MDNHIILRTVLIILAAAVLFSLVYYYNSRQNVQTLISPAAAPAPANMNTTETFYQRPHRNQFGPSSETYNEPKPGFEPPRIVEETQRQLSAQPEENMKVNSVQPSYGDMNSEFKTVDFTGQKLPNDCFPKDRLTTEDLLPKDAANLKWSAVNPSGQGDVSNINFVQAGAMLGINSTLGSRVKTSFPG